MATTPLRRYLSKTGLSCRQFSRLSGLDFTYISRLATGERCPGMGAAFKIEKATSGAIPIKSWKRFSQRAA